MKATKVYKLDDTHVGHHVKLKHHDKIIEGTLKHIKHYAKIVPSHDGHAVTPPVTEIQIDNTHLDGLHYEHPILIELKGYPPPSCTRSHSTTTGKKTTKPTSAPATYANM